MTGDCHVRFGERLVVQFHRPTHLDFSVKSVPKSFENLEDLMQRACALATKALQSSGENVEFKSEKYIEKQPHPEGQQAYIIQARLPWHRNFHTKVYVEVTFQEIILMEPEERHIIHPYDEAIQGSVYVYPLEEILAEKIRALLQFAKKLHERGWGRSRVRDYYDLWRIFTSYSHDLKLDILLSLVKQKCAHKKVAFESFEDIFQEKLLVNLEKEWEPWLLTVVTDLPSKDRVLKDLREIFSRL